MSQNEDLTNDRADVYSRPSAYFDGDGALVVRASAANGCRRALWYAATEWQPTNPPTDESLTKKLIEAGKLLGIELLDHVVIGGDKAVSLKERGLITAL